MRLKAPLVVLNIAAGAGDNFYLRIAVQFGDIVALFAVREAGVVHGLRLTIVLVELSVFEICHLLQLVFLSNDLQVVQVERLLLLS